jgi:hypothetical protein
MSGPDFRHERTERGQAWLGGSAQGGERLADLFGIGRPERVLELEKELADLMTKVWRLESELRALRRIDESGAWRAEAAEPPTVELRRSPEPGERDYELHRCQGFDVYAGDRRLGVVEGVVYGSRPDRPDVLEIGSGRFGRRRPLLVPVEDVEAIEAGEATVIVRAAHSPAGRRRLAAAVARLRSPLPHG